MNTFQTLSATLPVILLVLVGILLHRIHLIKDETAQDIRNLVVNLTLPLLLFKAFGTMRFETRYLVIVAAIFTACALVMWLAARLRFIPGLQSEYSSFLMAGFEAGMLGYALFGSIYGEASIPNFAVIDLGQVLFVFFVLITRLEVHQGRRLSIRATIINFLKTPVIIGILAGIAANFSGAYRFLSDTELTSSLIRTAEILGGLTTPFVAIVIGYQLQFNLAALLRPLQTVLLRLVVWVGLALAFNYFVIHGWMALDRNFEAAVLLMAILPAPFVIPFYLRTDKAQERVYVLNTLSLGTVAALIGGMIIRLIY